MVNKIFFVKEGKPEKGFTKRNIKKLFTFDSGDIFWLVFFILLFFLIWGYYQDRAAMQDFLVNPGDWCANYYHQKTALENRRPTMPITNFSIFFNNTVVNISNGES